MFSCATDYLAKSGLICDSNGNAMHIL